MCRTLWAEVLDLRTTLMGQKEEEEMKQGSKIGPQQGRKGSWQPYLDGKMDSLETRHLMRETGRDVRSGSQARFPKGDIGFMTS
jgi:hypothetical protein